MDMVNSSRSADCDLVKDPKKTRRDLERFIKNEDRDHIKDLVKAQRLWSEISLFVWEEAMIKDKAS